MCCSPTAVVVTVTVAAPDNITPTVPSGVPISPACVLLLKLTCFCYSCSCYFVCCCFFFTFTITFFCCSAFASTYFVVLAVVSVTPSYYCC